MKYTNLQLQEYFTILDSVASKVTGKLAYVVSKNARKITDELKEYNEIRDGKIQEYGEEKDGTVGIAYNSPEYYKFMTEMKEYDEVEIELSFVKINPEDLYSSNLNAIEINNLLFMINEEEDI